MRTTSLVGRPIPLIKPYAAPNVNNYPGARVVMFEKPYRTPAEGNMLGIDLGEDGATVPYFPPYLQGTAPNMARRGMAGWPKRGLGADKNASKVDPSEVKQFKTDFLDSVGNLMRESPKTTAAVVISLSIVAIIAFRSLGKITGG